MPAILGINAFHGDASACLVIDGKVVAAVEEERFRRVKHWAGFPSEAIKYCVSEAGLQAHEIEHVAFSRNPRARLLKKAWFALRRRPSISLVRSRLTNMAKTRGIRGQIADALGVAPAALGARTHWIEHHRAHSASAFFVSPFERAAVISVDAFGDFRSTTVSVGHGATMREIGDVGFPHSLGLLYTAVTQYLGFPRYGDEYKVMGLAAYGEPTYLDEFRRMVKPTPDGGFVLDTSYFLHYSKGVSMTWDDCEPEIEAAYSDRMVERLGPARRPDEPIIERHQNIAASLQAVLEEIYFHVLRFAQESTGERSLALAGGVAFNSVANGKILQETPFDEVYIQPAAGDAGTALGAAFQVQHEYLGYGREFVMDTAYLGPEFDDTAIAAALDNYGLSHRRLDDDELISRTARALKDGRIVGWFQARSEFGPRALGNRSILADPRRAELKETLNSIVKRREPFRPFAPSVQLEYVGDYFEQSYPDPFMIKVYGVLPEKREVVPAITHVDGSGRLQTVRRQDNPRYWKLIDEFRRTTGVAMLLNTSFNESEPIVNRPEEAVDCFLRTEMDMLVMGNHIVERNSGPADPRTVPEATER